MEEISELVKDTNRNNQVSNSEQINSIVAQIFNIDENELKYINDKLVGY